MTVSIQYNKDLQALNTLTTPAVADVFCAVHDNPELDEALAYARRDQLLITVLGEGSNVYFAKDRYAYYGQFFAGLLSFPATLQAWLGNPENGLPILGQLQALPHENVLDHLYRNKATVFEIGTLYTTVAGLLNILVICDAYGGPVYGRAPDAESDVTAQRPGRITV